MSGFGDRMAEAGEMIFESGETQSVTYTHGGSDATVTGVLRVTGDREEQDADQVTRKAGAEALFRRADVAAVTVNADTVEDADGRLWVVSEIVRQSEAFWRLRLTEHEAMELSRTGRTMRR